MPSDDSRNVVHIGGNKLGRAKRADVSRQTPDEDAFSNAANSSEILSTPYSLSKLTETVQQSSIVQQCIDAMVVNVASNGFYVVPTDPEQTLDDVDQTERDTLHSFIQYANPVESLRQLNEKLKSDYETYGYSFREIIRSRNKRVSALRHVPAFNLRIMTETGGYTMVTKYIDRGGRRMVVREMRLFKRYVQELASTTANTMAMSKGSSRVYFKEFGDPRRMDYRDGRYATDEKPVADQYLATEILHEKQISPDAYGIPKWVAAMPSILGVREAEEVNLDYFENNTVPPAMLTVSGGRLTQKSFQAINDLLDGDGMGKQRSHKMMLVEAIAESSGLEDTTGTVQIKLEKLTDVRKSDGLFKEYEESSQKKVQSLFRLPPVLLGRDSGNYANANTSIHVAETQVFQPDRIRHDDYWNMNLINHPEGLGLKTVKLQSKSMEITESAEVVKAIATLNVAGVLTPRKATKIAREVLGMDIDLYPEVGEDGYESWMDTPTPLSTRSTTENKPPAEPRPSEASPEEKLKMQEATGETPPPENSEK